MKCIVLAAGYATRLYPLTQNFPKPLLKVADKSILNWVLDTVGEKITEIIVVSNHKFYEYFLNWSKEQNYNVPIVILDDGSTDNEHRLGAVKDIQFALGKSGEINDDDGYLIVAGDNVIDFKLSDFIDFAIDKGCSCITCHEENELAKQQKTAIITIDETNKITSYEEKPLEPKGNFAVPPFYFYYGRDIKRIDEALSEGCSADAPGSYAAWLSHKTNMYAWKMVKPDGSEGHRFDIGDIASYEKVQTEFGNKK
ncbi:MAG: NTP transferase domain-containing protein [Butyrivibrio sp.]|nr:NTP transferase domain-containing protein [Butyrivibrio sp.]